ncbi:cell surface protein [Polaribacter batillariae]|uniref:Cell surface protein n=1 Tax=Polaribacter batillariae TaxID=2808900 RepID=A0ABX7SW16_9FLAO|nr:DUF5074 domain-containing protein [Polaribacter batillariae]QTD37849.1 cell surface protein [Polaribacter batillariae]
MKINKLLSILALSAIIFTSCSKEDSPLLPKGDYENGILISGEGSPSAGTGSVSYVSNDLTTTENLIYKKANSEELGTFLQSMAFDDNRAFIIVDNQNTISVVNRYTFKKESAITVGLQTPRYMTIVGNKGYVTNWGSGSFGDNVSDDFISIVNLETYEVESKIDVAVGPERILAHDGKLYVSHKGGFGMNNKISIIDIATSKVVKEITVNDIPDEIFIDNNNFLVVLCEGKAAWTGNETLASITRINTTNNTIESKIEFANGMHPSLMVLDNTTAYYSVGNSVYKMNISDTELPTTEFLTISLFTTGGFASFYGMAVKDDKFYALNTRFSDISELQVFNLSDKKQIKTVEAPIGASKIYFN